MYCGHINTVSQKVDKRRVIECGQKKDTGELKGCGRNCRFMHYLLMADGGYKQGEPLAVK